MHSTGHRVRILTVETFGERFRTDAQCAEFLARLRWRDGFFAPLLDTCTKLKTMTYAELKAAEVH